MGERLRLVFVADGRSPIAINWIRYFTEGEHEVHLVSTFPSQPDLRLASYTEIPTAFSGLKSNPGQTTGRANLQKILPVGLRTGLRQWFGPLTLPLAARRLQTVLDRVRPDLVHAMRIPYEGMLAALAGRLPAPLIISIWGNDFTLHAPSTPLMSYYTRLALRRASALHTDCIRDLRLAREWGFPNEGLSAVLPGGGGIQMDVFYPQAGSRKTNRPVIVNPRGIRAYVRNDTFFSSIPLVLKSLPQARFLCPQMAEEPEGQRWLEEFGIAASVELLPRLSRSEMADIFRKAWVVVSPSTHDGTPNTLLEAMACGAFPVVGDIESLREWIEPGVNGYLVNPSDAKALATAVVNAIKQPALRERAAQYNVRLVSERAEYHRVMQEADAFYRQILQDS